MLFKLFTANLVERNSSVFTPFEIFTPSPSIWLFVNTELNRRLESARGNQIDQPPIDSSNFSFESVLDKSLKRSKHVFQSTGSDVRMRWPRPWPSPQLILREASDSSVHLWSPSSWIHYYCCPRPDWKPSHGSDLPGFDHHHRYRWNLISIVITQSDSIPKLQRAWCCFLQR